MARSLRLTSTLLPPSVMIARNPNPHLNWHIAWFSRNHSPARQGRHEVYRARDMKLKREVAIKILPEQFSRDHDRVIRFQREAEVLASLNHPNIAAIYDLAESNDTRF